MIADVHSHILPGIDDGSASPEETARWLAMIEKAFPGMPIQYDDLSLGVSCHTGEGALGVGLSIRPRA